MCKCCKNHREKDFDWEAFINEDDENEETEEEFEEPKLTMPVWKFQEVMRKTINLLEVGFFDTKEVWMSTTQAAKWFGVNDRTVRRWIEAEKIEANDVGNAQTRYIVKVNLDSRWFDPIESKEIW